MTETTLPYKKISGSSKEIGYKIGKEFKENITGILTEFSDFQKHKRLYPQKKNLIKQMFEISKRLCPRILDEIEGIADGSGFDFNDIFIHNCMHMPYWLNCSTSVLKQDGRIFIAHNEDAHPILEKYAYFVFIKPEYPESIPFFSHSYPGIVSGMSYGFNLAGLVQTCNSLPDPIKSIGIPRMFIGRTIFEQAHTIDEGIDIINNLNPRSGGASYTLALQSQQNIVNVETTGTDHSVIPIRRNFFRANHYISNKFVKYPAASKHTLTRQERGDVITPKVKESDELLEVMWDPSIYLTMEGTNNDCQTNSTLVFEISKEDIIMKKYSNFPNRDFTLIKLSDLRKN